MTKEIGYELFLHIQFGKHFAFCYWGLTSHFEIKMIKKFFLGINTKISNFVMSNRNGNSQNWASDTFTGLCYWLFLPKSFPGDPFCVYITIRSHQYIYPVFLWYLSKLYALMKPRLLLTCGSQTSDQFKSNCSTHTNLAVGGLISCQVVALLFTKCMEGDV